jgi:polysaccharide pyruvyl transferase WcaK-like protein
MTTLNTTGRVKQPKKIAFFGHFGGYNWGNESTLQAVLCHLRRVVPNAEFNCICSDPSTVAMTYDIAAVSSRALVDDGFRAALVVEYRTLHSPLARLARKLVVEVPSELWQWVKSIRTLWGTDALVVPGTGLLTDAYSLRDWGPYDLFRWSIAARLCRCKILFVSVGAGPLYSRAGRFFVKTALSLADFRSYRDESSLRYLEGIGFRAGNDPVYPDLAFSLPESLVPRGHDGEGRRPVVGLGLMVHAGRYSVERPATSVYSAYLETLVEFTEWLFAHEYDVRLLIGDAVDTPATQEFKSLLKKRSLMYGEERIIDEPIASVDDLLKQLAATDVVVATRFHNVLLALLLNKPVIAISFHQKCASLMSQMGLSEYCQDINRLSSVRLIEQFSQLRQSSDGVKRMIMEEVRACRDALDEQYAVILSEICSE